MKKYIYAVIMIALAVVFTLFDLYIYSRVKPTNDVLWIWRLFCFIIWVFWIAGTIGIIKLIFYLNNLKNKGG